MSCCTGNQNTNTASLTNLSGTIGSLVDAAIQAHIGTLEKRIKELETANSKLAALVAQAESSAQVAQDAKQHLMGVVDQCNEISRLMAEKLADGFNVNGEFIYNGKTYKFKHGIIVEVK